VSACAGCGREAAEWLPILQLWPAAPAAPGETRLPTEIGRDPEQLYCTPCRAATGAHADRAFEATWMQAWCLELGRRACCDRHRPSLRTARVRWRRAVVAGVAADPPSDPR